MVDENVRELESMDIIEKVSNLEQFMEVASWKVDHGNQYCLK